MTAGGWRAAAQGCVPRKPTSLSGPVGHCRARFPLLLAEAVTQLAVSGTVLLVDKPCCPSLWSVRGLPWAPTRLTPSLEAQPPPEPCVCPWSSKPSSTHRHVHTHTHTHGVLWIMSVGTLGFSERFPASCKDQRRKGLLGSFLTLLCPRKLVAGAAWRSQSRPCCLTGSGAKECR